MRNKKNFFISFFLIGILCLIVAFGYKIYMEKIRPTAHIYTLEEIEHKYANIAPTRWSENLEGVTTILPDKSKPVVYLTFDACGGAYDKALIDYLIAHNIQATLFINARWIHKHTDDFIKLAQNPLFSIQNHGTKH